MSSLSYRFRSFGRNQLDGTYDNAIKKKQNTNKMRKIFSSFLKSVLFWDIIFLTLHVFRQIFVVNYY